MSAGGPAGISHTGHRKVVGIDQDVRFKCKQQKIYKKLAVHDNIKNVKKRSVVMGLEKIVIFYFLL